MRCVQCAGDRVRARRENHEYLECGLPGITLADVEVRRCATCGHRSVVIPGLSQLHRAIAEAVIRKPTALTRQELRFLRKHLGLSGRDFAEVVASKPETVSRWENGGLLVPPQIDRLVRLLVATGSPQRLDYSIDDLRGLQRRSRPLRLELVREDEGWLAA